MIACLRCEFCGTEINENIRKQMTEDNLTRLYKLAVSHDIENIIADVLLKEKILKDGKIADIYRNSLLMSVFRYQQLNYEYIRVCNLFEENKIEYIPLKGSVMRKYYPEPWLRTSCDIDILVKEDDLEHASELLINELKYSKARLGPHDVSFHSESDVSLELHYVLIENRAKRRWNPDYLEHVWECSSAADGRKYMMEMSDEIFYLYHIAHMAKHFEGGGCGIRSFIDLWILDNKLEYDIQKRNKLLEKSGLVLFSNAVRRLTRIWFYGESYDDLSNRIEDYILHSGVYGNIANRVAVSQNKKGGKFKYFVSRIVLPYDSLKYRYPILNKHKWLLPFCEILRWFQLVFCGRLGFSVRELSINSNMTQRDIEKTSELIDKLGI